MKTQQQLCSSRRMALQAFRAFRETESSHFMGCFLFQESLMMTAPCAKNMIKSSETCFYVCTRAVRTLRVTVTVFFQELSGKASIPRSTSASRAPPNPSVCFCFHATTSAAQPQTAGHPWMLSPSALFTCPKGRSEAPRLSQQYRPTLPCPNQV